MPASSNRAIKVRLRVTRGDEDAFGPGKAQLLESLLETGSLNRTASTMKMSYVKALALVRSSAAVRRRPASRRPCRSAACRLSRRAPGRGRSASTAAWEVAPWVDSWTADERGGSATGVAQAAKVAERLMEKDNTYKFKPFSERNPELAKAGITPDNYHCYCGTSREGSLLRFYLKHVAGYPDVRFYEGAWKEYVWLKDKSLVVRTGGEPAGK